MVTKLEYYDQTTQTSEIKQSGAHSPHSAVHSKTLDILPEDSARTQQIAEIAEGASNDNDANVPGASRPKIPSIKNTTLSRDYPEN